MNFEIHPLNTVIFPSENNLLMFKKGVFNLAIYIDSIPYLKTQYKKVALPRSGTMISSTGNEVGQNKSMYGNLVFLFTTDIT